MFIEKHFFWILSLIVAFVIILCVYRGITSGPEFRIKDVFSQQDYEDYYDLRNHVIQQCMSLEYGEERDRAIKEAMDRRNALIEKYRDKLGPDFKVKWNLSYSI